MSTQEYDLMTTTGFVQESNSGTTHVASPVDQGDFQAQAVAGSVYVEFDVPRDSVKPLNRAGLKSSGRTRLKRLAAAKGRPVPQMPPVGNIQHVATK